MAAEETAGGGGFSRTLGPIAGRGGGGSGGGITEVESTDGSVTVTNPTGPIVNLSVPNATGVTSLNGLVDGLTLSTTKPGDSISTPTSSTVVIAGGGIARVANLTALAALAAAAFPIGNTWCWVDTVGAYYQLQTSALATTTTTVIAASGVASARWLRMNWRNPVWQAQTSWTVNTSTGNDENPGSSGSPLLTLSEVARRLAYAELTAAMTTTVIGNMATTDVAEFTCYLAATAASITIAGTPTAIYAGTLTGTTAAGAAPTTGQNTITDAAITGGSFTAAGALAQGVLFTRTSGTVCSWFAAKDNGALTARISAPQTLTVAQTLAPGDSYNFMQLPLLTMPRFPNVALYGQTTTLKNWLATSGLNKMVESFFFVNCWLVNPRLTGGMTLSNVCLQGASVFGAPSNFPETAFSLIGGLLLGTGITNIALQGCPYAQLISVAVTMQSCQLAVTDGSYLDQNGPDLLSYDSATYPILVDYSSSFLQKHSGAFGGSNNAGLVNVGHGSRFMYTTNPYFVAGSSNDLVTPIQANGTAATNIAGLPVVTNNQGNGVFSTS
jgi:hypothetical protein